MTKEPKFKVGDWVKIKDSYKLLPHQKRIFVIDFIDDYNNLFGADKDRGYSNSSYCELWEPKVGEWCWQSKWDRIICLDYDLIKFVTNMNEIDDSYEYRYEPFIGTLPSFIKD